MQKQYFHCDTMIIAVVKDFLLLLIVGDSKLLHDTWKRDEHCQIPSSTHRNYMKNKTNKISNMDLPTIRYLTWFVLVMGSTNQSTTLLAELRIQSTLQMNKKKRCPGYETNLHPVVRLQFWSSEECGVSHWCYYSQVTTLFVRVTSMD